MVRRVRRAVLGLCVTVIVSSCAANRDDLIASFAVANPGATPTQSACVVDGLIERYGVEGLEGQLVADPVSPTYEEQQLRTMVHCGMTDMIREQLVSQLVALDVPPQRRDCVADELTVDISDDDLDVLISGVITDEFYANFFDALTDCEALP